MNILLNHIKFMSAPAENPELQNAPQVWIILAGISVFLLILLLIILSIAKKK